MNQAEARVLRQMPHIEAALARALEDAAGEPMAFILMVTSSGRVGTHLITSNIKETRVVVEFLKQAVVLVRNSWREGQELAKEMADRVLN
jgi:hypothetical protein